MKKTIAGIGVLVSLAAAGIWWFRWSGAPPLYRTEPVTRGAVKETVSASGTITPVTTVQVGTQVSGRVLKLHADFNSAVRRGQPIAEIDPAPFQAQVEQAEASRGVARANLEKAEAQALEAERAFKRTRELFAQAVASQNDLEAAETAAAAARAQVSVARAQLVQAEASLRLARTNLDYTTVISPVDGLVISRSVDVGQTVAASFQTPTLFSIAEDLTRMQIHASVDEADIGRVKEGQPVSFTVDAYPDEEFRGTVTQVRNAPVTQQNVVTYTVVVAVDNGSLRLKPGMTANVSFETAEVRDALRVPAAALRVKVELPEERKGERPEGGKVGRPERGKAGRSEGGKAGKAGGGTGAGNAPAGTRGPAVWVVENGQPRRVAVRPGLSDGMWTAVESDELREGMEVLVESPGAGRPGQNAAPRPPRFM
jgi:HlyD family secretion protein